MLGFFIPFVLFMQVRRQNFQNEFNILATLPFHENIIRLKAFFYDRMGISLPGMQQFDAFSEGAQTLSLYLVMEHLPINLDTLSKEYRNNGKLTVRGKLQCPDLFSYTRNCHISLPFC